MTTETGIESVTNSIELAHSAPASQGDGAPIAQAAPTRLYLVPPLSEADDEPADDPPAAVTSSAIVRSEPWPLRTTDTRQHRLKGLARELGEPFMKLTPEQQDTEQQRLECLVDLANKSSSDKLALQLAARGYELVRTDSADIEAAALPRARRAITQGKVLDVMREHSNWAGTIRFNQFTNEPEIHGGGEINRWNDVCTTRAIEWFGKTCGDEPSPAQVERAITLIATENRYHPVRNWLDRLTWDGAPRIERMWADYFGAEQSDYCAATGSKFMIGAVARIYEPGCKRDEMPILEGPQGTRKSTGLRVLFSDEWFSDTALDIGNKDAMATLQGKWLIEFGELAAMRTADVNKLKVFMSSAVDRFRPAYGRRDEEFKRQQVFAGTVNPDGGGYFHDPTGNRRFWPVKCGAVNVDAIKRDREQLFAEAVERYKAGAQWHLTPEESDLAREEQGDRQAEDPWLSVIDEWWVMISQPQLGAEQLADRTAMGSEADGRRLLKAAVARALVPDDWTTAGLTTPLILESALGVEPRNQGRAHESRLGVIMKELQWVKHRRRTGDDGARTYRWYPPS